MAKKNEVTIEKMTVEVEARVNLKYDSECFKIGTKFNVRLNDAEELSSRGLVEIIGELYAENEGVSLVGEGE